MNRAEADIVDSDIINNYSSTSGGGLAIVGGRGEYAYLRIDINQAYLVGAGVFITNIFSNNFYNCRMSWNQSGAEGAGVYSAYACPAFYNCTIGSNTSSSHGGIYAEGNYAPVLMNCIVYGNGGPGLFSDTTPMIVTYSDIEWTTGQVYPGTGNMNTDPLFVTDWLRLSHVAAGQSVDSPCINAGSNSASAMCVSTFRGSWCLNEFSTRTDAMPDTGTVDMGFHVSVQPADADPIADTNHHAHSVTDANRDADPHIDSRTVRFRLLRSCADGRVFYFLAPGRMDHSRQ